jgi:hypothetical protein
MVDCDTPRALALYSRCRTLSRKFPPGDPFRAQVLELLEHSLHVSIIDGHEINEDSARMSESLIEEMEKLVKEANDATLSEVAP